MMTHHRLGRRLLPALITALLLTRWLPIWTPIWAATAFVQQSSFNQTGGQTSIPVTLTGVAAGNLLAVYVSSTVSTVTITSVAGNSNTYTLADGPTVNGTALVAWQYYAKGVTAGSTTITVTFSAAAGSTQIVVHEISGTDTVSPLDQHKLVATTNVGTGTDAHTTSPGLTTTTNGQYIFGATSNDNFSLATAGTGYALRAGASTAPASEDRIQSTAGSTVVTFTEGTDAFDNSLEAIMTFKAAAGGAPACGNLRLLGVGCL